MNDSIKILLEVIDNASPQLQQFQQNLQKTGNAAQAFGGLLKGLAIAGAGAAFVSLIKGAIDTADAMNDASERLGITTESLSALGYAAKMSGTNMETLQTGLQQLNKSIVEAQDPSSAAANAFKYMGISVKDASGNLKSADKVFAEMADKFTKMPEGPSKTAVAMELLGKGGAALIPMLNSGKAGLEEFRAEAERLGVVISKETAEQAGKFNDSLDRVGNAATGVALGIASEVLPTLNNLAVEMIKNVKEGEGFKNFARGVGEVFKWLVKRGFDVVFVFNTIGKGIGALAAAVVAVLNRDFAGAKAIISDYADETKRSYEENEKSKDSFDNLAPAVEKSAKATDNAKDALKDYAGNSKTAKEAKDAENKAFEKAYAALIKESEGYKDLTAVQQVEYNIAKKVAGFRDADNQKRLIQQARIADAVRLETIALREQATARNDLTRLNKDLMMTTAQLSVAMGIEQEHGKQAADNYLATRAAANSLLSTLEQLREAYRVALAANNTKEASALEAQIAIRQKQYSAFVAQDSEDAKRYAKTIENQRIINQEVGTWRSLVGDVRDRTKELSAQEELVWKWLNAGSITAKEFELAMQKLDKSKLDNLKSQVTDLEKKTADFAGAIQSTFGDVFYNIMQGNFTDIGSAFKQMLDKMVAEALAAKLAQALFGDFSRTGSVSGQGGGLLTSLVGSLFSFRAEGGPVTAGQPYIVGEKRPELFVPRTSGTILPDTSALAMAGGNSVQLSITAMDSQDVIRALDKIKRPLADMVNSTGRAYNMK